MLDGLDDGAEVGVLERGVARAARKERVAGEEERGALDGEAHRAGGVPRGGDGGDPEPAHLQLVAIDEELVVGGQHSSISLGHGHVEPGIPHGLDGLDVVPVPVGLDNLTHAEGAAKVE